MSTTPPPEPPEQPTAETAEQPSPPRRLTRSRDDRYIAGVCGGLAKYLNVDPVIVRIVAIVLVFFGGAGLLLYLAGVLLVPNEGETAAQSTGQRNRALVILGIIALIVLAGPLLFAPIFIAGGLLFPLAFLALAGLVMAWLATGRWPERETGPIVRATLLGLGILAVLGVVALGAFWGSAEGGDEVVAGLVIAAGVALVVGAFVRPVRWLIPFALALALPAGFVSAAGIDLSGGYGEKHYRPGTVAEVRPHYEVGAGELLVDLRSVDLPAGDRRVDLEIGMGEATVLVDPDVCVATRADVGMGAIELFGDETGGVDIDFADEPTAPEGRARLIVNADVGLGALRIAYDRDDQHFDWRRDRGPFQDRFFDDELQPDNVGCERS